MPRIIVTTDGPAARESDSVLLEEHIHSVHLSSDHAARQLVERLAWAIGDAEAAEAAGPRRRAHALAPPLAFAAEITSAQLALGR
jgi:hypothetical protein